MQVFRIYQGVVKLSMVLPGDISLTHETLPTLRALVGLRPWRRGDVRRVVMKVLVSLQ